MKCQQSIPGMRSRLSDPDGVRNGRCLTSPCHFMVVLANPCGIPASPQQYGL